MNETVLYSLQTILSAGVFILIYRLFVRNTNAYNWNRFYLLSTMIISLFLPYIDISSWFTTEKPIIFYASMIDFGQAISITPNQQVRNTFNLSELIMTGYWIIAGLLLLRFGWGIMRIIELAKNDDYKKSGNLRIYPVQRKTTFSFFNYIFIQPEYWEKPSIDYIIKHEQAHVNLLHSLDNILTELILAFGWFNPFYYVYRSDLHLLHECQADQQVINSGYDKTTYHQLLLNEVSGNLTYIIVNQFSYSLIKRRFKMISKNKQSRLAGFRILLAIPTAFALLLLFSFTSLEKTTSLLKNDILQPTILATQSSFDNLQKPQQKPVVKKPVKSTVKFTPPDIESHYPGGNEAWMDLVEKNLNYKLITPNNMVGIDFLVYIQFTISENGDVLNPKVIRGMNKTCDQEALRLIKMMPKWKPVIKNGKAVSVNYILPIKFKVKYTPPVIKPDAAGSQPENKVNYEDKPLLVVEQNPEYKGGYEAMIKFIKENIHYPDNAIKSGIQGTVFVQFVISKTGKISNIKILRGIGSDCDEEAIRIVKEMPDWIPGRQKGEVVPVMFQIPIKFQLKTTYTPVGNS